MTELQESYENAECPDCGEAILDNYVEGDECPECGHVFTIETDEDED